MQEGGGKGKGGWKARWFQWGFLGQRGPLFAPTCFRAHSPLLSLAFLRFPSLSCAFPRFPTLSLAFLRFPPPPLPGRVCTAGNHGSVHRAAWLLASWTARLQCITLSYMAALTLRLDPKLQRELDRLCRRLGRTRSEVVRDALRRQVALLRFQEGRQRLMPFAGAAGYLTDEDVFRDVS